MRGRVWLALAGIVLGVLLQPFLELRFVSIVTLASLVAVILRRHLMIAALAYFLLCASAGWAAALMHATNGIGLRLASVDFPRCEIEGRVLEHAGGLGTLSAIDASDCAPTNHGMVVMSPIDLTPGTRFDATGWLGPLDGTGFDMARARLGADAEFIAADITPYEIEGTAHAAAGAFRAALSDAAQHLPPERKGIVLGMTIGDTSAVPEPSLEHLRRAGLTHLLAVSGSNVAIVLGSVALCLRRLSLNARIIGSGLALAFYLLVVGPEPSVLRAGAMGAIALLALWRGHPTRSLQLLGLALIVVLLLRPALVYSPGLHLSAAATFGIVFWSAPLARRFTRLPLPIALALGATLAAQFAVSPVLLATFGEVSLVAPLANVLAFPVVAPVTVVGLAAGVLALVWPGGGGMLMSVLSPLSGWVVEVGARVGGAEWAAAEVPGWWGVPAAVVVAASAWSTLRRREAFLDAPSRDDAGMGDWHWRLHDPEGNDLRETQQFESKEEAESWMGTEWQSLLDEGAETVSLTQGGVIVYTMGLKEE